MDESIISKNMVTIDKDSNIHAALEIMEKKHITRLMVTENRKIIGIITEGDIANRMASGRERTLKSEHIHVSSAAVGDLRTVDAGIPLNEVAKIMLENKFSSVPVTKNGEIIGIVTKTDLVKTLKDSQKQVRDFYTKNPLTVNPADTLLSARMLMLREGVHRLLVTNDGILQGILTERDMARGLKTFRKAIDKYPQADIERLRVELVMKPNPTVVKPSDTIGRVVELMDEKGISGIPVVAMQFGIITKTDLVKGMADGILP